MNQRLIDDLRSRTCSAEDAVKNIKSGSFVTTGRNDAQYIVTEYGVAQLKGYNMRDRAKALISIAHPEFRERLTSEAKKLKYI
jgi:acyl-CoA hydrolase